MKRRSKLTSWSQSGAPICKSGWREACDLLKGTKPPPSAISTDALKRLESLPPNVQTYFSSKPTGNPNVIPGTLKRVKPGHFVARVHEETKQRRPAGLASLQEERKPRSGLAAPPIVKKPTRKRGSRIKIQPFRDINIKEFGGGDRVEGKPSATTDLTRLQSIPNRRQITQSPKYYARLATRTKEGKAKINKLWKEWEGDQRQRGREKRKKKIFGSRKPTYAEAKIRGGTVFPNAISFIAARLAGKANVPGSKRMFSDVGGFRGFLKEQAKGGAKQAYEKLGVPRKVRRLMRTLEGLKNQSQSMFGIKKPKKTTARPSPKVVKSLDSLFGSGWHDACDLLKGNRSSE